MPELSMNGRVESINVSSGGVPKTSVFETLLTRAGLDGDRQRDTRFHGGPDRAVVLYSFEMIRQLQREGHPIAVGSIGENLTIAGLDWASVVPGVELLVGGTRILVTKYTSPCDKIRLSFLANDFSRVSQLIHPGWSRVCGKVLVEGLVRVADAVGLMSHT